MTLHFAQLYLVNGNLISNAADIHWRTRLKMEEGFNGLDIHVLINNYLIAPNWQFDRPGDRAAGGKGQKMSNIMQ